MNLAKFRPHLAPPCVLHIFFDKIYKIQTTSGPACICIFCFIKFMNIIINKYKHQATSGPTWFFFKFTSFTHFYKIQTKAGPTWILYFLCYIFCFIKTRPHLAPPEFYNCLYVYIKSNKTNIYNSDRTWSHLDLYRFYMNIYKCNMFIHNTDHIWPHLDFINLIKKNINTYVYIKSRPHLTPSMFFNINYISLKHKFH